MEEKKSVVTMKNYFAHVIKSKISEVLYHMDYPDFDSGFETKKIFGESSSTVVKFLIEYFKAAIKLLVLGANWIWITN